MVFVGLGVVVLVQQEVPKYKLCRVYYDKQI